MCHMSWNDCSKWCTLHNVIKVEPQGAEGPDNIWYDLPLRQGLVPSTRYQQIGIFQVTMKFLLSFPFCSALYSFPLNFSLGVLYPLWSPISWSGGYQAKSGIHGSHQGFWCNKPLFNVLACSTHPSHPTLRPVFSPDKLPALHDTSQEGGVPFSLDIFQIRWSLPKGGNASTHLTNLPYPSGRQNIPAPHSSTLIAWSRVLPSFSCRLPNSAPFQASCPWVACPAKWPEQPSVPLFFALSLSLQRGAPYPQP